ncbi:MAG TPA: tetratricopeptide repeat protein [Kofleriaceae bacterium]|nr:tetratricopeptide repeat protein [Kofleriaceae bacterium]
MSEDPRVPSPDELERLEQAVRQDPASRHFVRLGDAYLHLGRARDAVQVGARGLQGDPANIEGRMMVSRALVALHQWKQAQAELLKVVKGDKQNSDGFRLLGEVLMRRADYERALPVLQHAQNLDPANPGVLALIKRARAGQPLDPPDPIPTPRGVRGAARPRLPAAAAPSRGRVSGPAPIDDEPTNVAPSALMDDLRGGLDDRPTDLIEMSLRDDATHPSLAPELTRDEAIRARLPLQSKAATGPSPTVPASPPRPKRSSAAPPQAKPSVLPRIMPAERRPDAAKEGLRQSAAMGEDYLNNLLAGGLLEVPNVRVPADDYDPQRNRGWEPRTKRAFVFLFTLLFLGTAGGVGWYVHSTRKQAAAVAGHLDTASAKLQHASLQDLEQATRSAQAAIARDKTSLESVAKLAEVGGISALLYMTSPDEAEYAYTGARKDIDAGKPGDRSLVVAQAALTLARLSEMEDPVPELTKVIAKLDAYLEAREDGWIRWLRGRAALATGDRTLAMQYFGQAAALPDAPLVATISRGDLLLDEGKYAEADALYDEALAASPNHPLALLGKSLSRAERSVQLSEAMDDLNVHLARAQSPRVDAYKQLAFAFTQHALQQYADFEKSMERAIGVNEPRFWARVGLARLLGGNVRGAAEARQRVLWYAAEGTPREEDPLVLVLDAELSLALGRPQAALAKAGKTEGLRGHRLRGRALFDQGDYADSIAELERGIEVAPEDRELRAYLLAARAIHTQGAARREALEELATAGSMSNSKLPSYLQGFALMQHGKLEDARYALEKSVTDISVAEPNPLAYRSHLALGELALLKGKVDTALDHLQKSAEVNAVYLPTLAALARVHLAKQEWAEAADVLGQVLAAGQESLKTWQIELGYAEAIMQQTDAGADARKAAREALLRAREKGAPPEELARVAALFGPEMLPELLAELGVPAADEGSSKKPKKRRR